MNKCLQRYRYYFNTAQGHLKSFLDEVTPLVLYNKWLPYVCNKSTAFSKLVLLEDSPSLESLKSERPFCLLTCSVIFWRRANILKNARKSNGTQHNNQGVWQACEFGMLSAYILLVKICLWWWGHSLLSLYFSDSFYFSKFQFQNHACKCGIGRSKAVLKDIKGEPESPLQTYSTFPNQPLIILPFPWHRQLMFSWLLCKCYVNWALGQNS